ncbi:3'-5' exonuclease [Faecalicatena sp. AGMB00832]|uniref:3'-5' exonuclease n=1 Tax=Faecalicatena faecalis TaxID=2726362 RepID=A0ABS6D670_9FIRM|nr:MULTISPECIES: 3'-5' exonuclease [Faecalicatena]MBU3877093.1 3'-5' exonuclease [Faecalicatena faecalis]MCI6467098.1 3'-5' exonuclease [Faecalicatena sp.]MDY5618882.1 exonuclease domain-containing protein [Lachnospiraceae bacterium]
MLGSYIAFDLETTGLKPGEHEIIEIGALKVRNGKVVERFMEFACPKEPITPVITNLTGITNEMVASARCSQDVVRDFLGFCEDDILIGHNVIFDYSFVKVSALNLGDQFEKSGIDTLKIARKVHKEMESKSLGSLCEYYHIENQAAHRAYHDALATAKLYQTLAHYFEEKEPKLFQPQPLIYKPKKEVPATSKQIGFLKKLIQNKGASLEWNPDTITKSEASRLIEELCSKP